MTANENGIPRDPDHEGVPVREALGETAEASAAKVDQLKERAQEKAVQAKDKASDLVSPVREAATPPAITSPPAVRGAGAGAVTIGVATAFVVWRMRRRARRNANPWLAHARTAKSQVKTLRRQAKSSVKATRKQSRAQAVAQVAAAKAKARKATARAKSWK